MYVHVDKGQACPWHPVKAPLTIRFVASEAMCSQYCLATGQDGAGGDVDGGWGEGGPGGGGDGGEDWKGLGGAGEARDGLLMHLYSDTSSICRYPSLSLPMKETMAWVLLAVKSTVHST